MPVPSTTPSRPGAITAAQALVGLQVVFLLCCGLAPVFVWMPTFLVMILNSMSVFVGVPFLLALLIGGIAYTVVTVRRLGDGDRRGRSWVSAGFAVVAALGFSAVLAAGGNSPNWHTLATAAPSIAAQAIAWICVHSTSAERWFRECEPYLRRPAGPAADPGD